MDLVNLRRGVGKALPRSVRLRLSRLLELSRTPGEFGNARAAAAHAKLLDDLPVVAMRARGGLGDHIMTARFIRDLTAVVGPFELDLFTSRLEPSEWIYAPFPQIRRMFSEHLMWDRYYHEYNLALDVSQFVHVPHADWLVASHKNPKLARVIENVDRYRWRIQPMIDNHPYLDAHLGRVAVFHNRRRRDYLQYIAKIPYGGDRYDLAFDESTSRKFDLEPEYITVHNGFEVDSDMARVSSTKVYPHFDAVVRQLKLAFPHLQIVQLGSSTSRLIDGVDRNLISRTSMTEVAGVLKNSLFHLDNESGLVHIASCYETPACVVFGPTDADYFGYPSNVNMKPAFCGNCWWHSRDWMSTCVRGFSEPRCLTLQRPDDVFKALEPKLREAVDRPR